MSERKPSSKTPEQLARQRANQRAYRERLGADEIERRRERNRLYMREYMQRPGAKERKREYTREYEPSPEVRERERDAKLRYLYGIGLADRDALLCAQGGKCAICSAEIVFAGVSGAHVDHCHETGFVRGALCNMCNRALGLFFDCKGSLVNAVHYLSRKPTAVPYRKVSYRAVSCKLRETMLAAQGGKCAVCLGETAFGGIAGAALDHCHATGMVRGVLCKRCNSGIAYFGEDRGNLIAAAHYLERAERAERAQRGNKAA